MNNIKRELTLPAPISKVKEIIDNIASQGSGKGFVLHDKNEFLNTYRLGIVQGITAGNCNITLTDKGEETNGVFEMINTTVNNGNIHNRMLDDLLMILGKGLSGEPITPELIKENKGGCFGVFLLIIFASAVFFLCSRSNSTTGTTTPNGDYWTKQLPVFGSNEMIISERSFKSKVVS